MLDLLPSPKFHSLLHYGQPFNFLSYRQFWDKCTEWSPKWPWTLKGQRYSHTHVTTTPESQILVRFTLWPAVFVLQVRAERLYCIYMLQLPSTPKFQFVLPYGQPFYIHMLFWDKCTKWPPNDLKALRAQRYPIHVSQLSTTLNFTPFGSTLSHFRVSGHFETSALNDPKMTLNTERSQLLHIHVTTTPASQNFTPFNSTASCFRVTGHFQTSALNDSKKWHWTLTRQRYPIYMLQLPPNSRFQSVSPYGLPFSSYRPFETIGPNDPKINLDTTRWKVCHIWPYMIYQWSPRVPNFAVFRTITSHFQYVWNIHFPIGHNDKFQSFLSWV